MAAYPPIVSIVGPTAVGKSELAMELASRFGGEILSVDSRQVYRYMDVGTAKPSQADRTAVPHYMLDLISPAEIYSSERYREEGQRVLARLAARGRVAFAVGGTGFYLAALLNDLTPPRVPPNPELRAALQAEAEREGASHLHRRLHQVDPESAVRIHPNNVARVIRALEIVHALGAPVPPISPESRLPALILGVALDRAALRWRIDRRAENQLRAGLVEETRLLIEMGFAGSFALQGLGYREMSEYLHGQLSLGAALARYQTATYQYARRQSTWFRRDANIRWLESSTAASDAAALIRDWLPTASSE